MSNAIENKATTGYRPFDHLERQGHRNTRGAEEGTVFVFPKIDGTNASVWSDGTDVFAGSRKRSLEDGKNGDNAGFRAWLMSDDQTAVNMRTLALANPSMIFYGEWLVPHTIRTYQDDAWRKFYIFDVFIRTEAARGYVPYDDYKSMLAVSGADYIEPQATLVNPTGAQLKAEAERSTFLMIGDNIGEGVVLKNYEWRNSAPEGWDRVWGKFVRSEFKSAAGAKCAPRPTTDVEAPIAEEFVTPTLVEKNLAKVLINVFNDLLAEKADDLESRPEHPDFRAFMIGNYRGRIIPQLLGRVWADILDEEIRAIVKAFKTPTIDFKALRAAVNNRTKTLASELF
jgi:hypothetical protein